MIRRGEQVENKERDWAEFKRYLNFELEQKAARHRIIMWVAIIMLALCNLASAAIAVSSIANSITTAKKVNALEKEIKIMKQFVSEAKNLNIYCRQ